MCWLCCQAIACQVWAFAAARVSQIRREAGTGQSDTMDKSAKQPLDIADALQIVIDLARQNALDAARCDPELRDEAQRQQEAVDMVEDLAVNMFGDD
jgi:hypothetical protein